jgi:hypothetical protein
VRAIQEIVDGVALGKNAAALNAMAEKLRERMDRAGHRPGKVSKDTSDLVRAVRELRDAVDRRETPVDPREWRAAVAAEGQRLVARHGERLATKILTELYAETRTRGRAPVLRRLKAEQT